MRASLILMVMTLVLAAPTWAYEDQHVLNDAELAAMATDTNAQTNLPLGDQRYKLDGPQRGYIYLCRVPPLGGGADYNGPWIHNDTWDASVKPLVAGMNYWSQARFSVTASPGARMLSGNGLPVGFPTGTFPVQPSDPAYRYDRNPNKITQQSYDETLPTFPKYSAQPYCMGMEVGTMMNGVPLNNGFDAGLRDAAAHEVQDICGGHPQQNGQYHYHNLSACLKDTSVKTVIGYALDGFPITGPMVTTGHYLTTRNLDECHGITSDVIVGGQSFVTYHYVMTKDFPYSASCFRAKPVRIGPLRSAGNGQANIMPANDSGPPAMDGNRPHEPPPIAFQVCAGRGEEEPCSFISPRGDPISGKCRQPPDVAGMVCVPFGR